MEKFISSELYKRFQTLRFFILSEKQRSYKPIDTQGLFKFDVQTDILDFRDLIEASKKLDTEPLSNVAEFLEQEFSNSSQPARPTQITELPCLNGDACVLAGERLRVIREDIGLKSSEFITLVGLPSERQYQLVESNQQESSLSLLRRVQETTGAALAWLQHGTPPRYPVSHLHWVSRKDAAQQVAEDSPQQVYATIETPGLHVGLCVQVTDWCYRVYELNLNLNFWDWVDEQHCIPLFYEFLLELENRVEVQGVRLNQKTDRSLYGGEIHASHALRQGSFKYMNWVTAVLDLDCLPRQTALYTKLYGAWFKKVQEEFRKYRE